MGAGQDITILADDDAGTGTALHVVAAKPGLGAAHLLGGNGHHAGGYHRRDLLHAHGRAVGAVGGRSVGGIALHLLDHHLVTGQAGTAGHNGAAHAAAEAQGHNAYTGQYPQKQVMLLFRLLRGLLGCAGVAVSVVTAVAAIAAAETAGITVVVPCPGVVVAAGVTALRGGGRRVGGILRGIVGARCVGGVHTAAAHVGVAAILRLLGVLCIGILCGGLLLRGAFARCMIVKPGVIKFVAHTGPSFPLSFERGLFAFSG